MNENFGLKPNITKSIIEFAKKCEIDKLVLFGSRARGDFKERSDIDLAISGGNKVKFITEIDDRIQTLLLFDIVDLDGLVQDELLNSIEKEGVDLYEKI